jgi:hypothetical protein
MAIARSLVEGITGVVQVLDGSIESAALISATMFAYSAAS